MATVNDQYGVVPAITAVANADGIDPNLAIAIARQESGLDPYRVGDQGTSFGLYQLHIGGELPAAWVNAPRVAGHGGSIPQPATDPTANAKVSLAVVANVAKAHPTWSGGQIAAAAQRPADQAGYARSINSMLGQSSNYTALSSAGNTTTATPTGNSASANPAFYGEGTVKNIWKELSGVAGAAQDAAGVATESGKFLDYLASNATEIGLRTVELAVGGTLLLIGLIKLGAILSSDGDGSSVSSSFDILKSGVKKLAPAAIAA